MNRESYGITIKELEALKKNLDERIREIREENGVDFSDVSDEMLESTVDGLEKLIDDRIENDDAQALWKTAVEIRRLESKIFEALRFMD